MDRASESCAELRRIAQNCAPLWIFCLLNAMLIRLVSSGPAALLSSPPAVDIHSPSVSLSLTKPIDVIRRDVSRLCGTQNSSPGLNVR